MQRTDRSKASSCPSSGGGSRRFQRASWSRSTPQRHPQARRGPSVLSAPALLARYFEYERALADALTEQSRVVHAELDGALLRQGLDRLFPGLEARHGGSAPRQSSRPLAGPLGNLGGARHWQDLHRREDPSCCSSKSWRTDPATAAPHSALGAHGQGGAAAGRSNPAESGRHPRGDAAAHSLGGLDPAPGARLPEEPAHAVQDRREHPLRPTWWWSTRRRWSIWR